MYVGGPRVVGRTNTFAGRVTSFAYAYTKAQPPAIGFWYPLETFTQCRGTTQVQSVFRPDLCIVSPSQPGYPFTLGNCTSAASNFSYSGRVFTSIAYGGHVGSDCVFNTSTSVASEGQCRFFTYYVGGSGKIAEYTTGLCIDANELAPLSGILLQPCSSSRQLQQGWQLTCRGGSIPPNATNSVPRGSQIASSTHFQFSNDAAAVYMNNSVEASARCNGIGSNWATLGRYNWLGVALPTYAFVNLVQIWARDDWDKPTAWSRFPQFKILVGNAFPPSRYTNGLLRLDDVGSGLTVCYDSGQAFHTINGFGTYPCNAYGSHVFVQEGPGGGSSAFLCAVLAFSSPATSPPGLSFMPPPPPSPPFELLAPPVLNNTCATLDGFANDTLASWTVSGPGYMGGNPWWPFLTQAFGGYAASNGSYMAVISSGEPYPWWLTCPGLPACTSSIQQTFSLSASVEHVTVVYAFVCGDDPALDNAFVNVTLASVYGSLAIGLSCSDDPPTIYSVFGNEFETPVWRVATWHLPPHNGSVSLTISASSTNALDGGMTSFLLLDSITTTCA